MPCGCSNQEVALKNCGIRWESMRGSGRSHFKNALECGAKQCTCGAGLQAQPGNQIWLTGKKGLVGWGLWAEERRGVSSLCQILYRLGEQRYAQIQFPRPMSRSDIDGQTFEPFPFSPKGRAEGESGYLGQARRSVIHLHLGHRHFGVSLQPRWNVFQLSGQQVLVEILYLLWEVWLGSSALQRGWDFAVPTYP